MVLEAGKPKNLALECGEGLLTTLQHGGGHPMVRQQVHQRELSFRIKPLPTNGLIHL
jgi:hypothetical protein